ncbi:LysR family transcriptional regulator [Rhodospirillum sp. A1_3_36]|uniref:LysR family transcriptional regulator n=1 Tax=Rhodospirillum sp. A1_3_36 TaxID=3391666 RepID=UPI0039A77DEA
MDIPDLQAFLLIVETGGFSAAAERLNVTQPALSRRMRLLEESLGERLLHRTGRGAEPTEAGLLLADRAHRILDEVDSARRALLNRKGQVTGRVTLGLPPSVGTALTARLVVRFREKYPLVALSIVEELSGVIQDGLRSGWIDIGLLYAGTEGPSLRSEVLFREDIALIGRPDLVPPAPGPVPHGPGAPPLPLHGLAELPLILPGRRHGLRAILDQTAFRHGISLNVGIEADSLRVLAELTELGLGMVIHAPSAFPRELAEGRFVQRPLGNPPLTRSIALAWPRDRATTQATLAMAEAVRRLVGELNGPKDMD